MSINLRLPRRLARHGRVLGNLVRQQAARQRRTDFDVERRAYGHVLTRSDGWTCLVTDRRVPPPGEAFDALCQYAAPERLPLAGGDLPGEWLVPSPLDPGMVAMNVIKRGTLALAQTWCSRR